MGKFKAGDKVRIIGSPEIHTVVHETLSEFDSAYKLTNTYEIIYEKFLEPVNEDIVKNTTIDSLPVQNSIYQPSRLDYFAGLALQGLCVPCTPGSHNSNSFAESENKAYMAVRLARALIKELEK